MDSPIAVVPVYADHFCRACFKELNTSTDAEANARVNLLEMPGLLDKLSACIANIFITAKRGSKYLCLDCFERVKEFYEFREMCLQSIRRFEEFQASEYIIAYKKQPIKSEGINDTLVPSEPVIKEEYVAPEVNELPEIFEESIENDNSEITVKKTALEQNLSAEDEGVSHHRSNSANKRRKSKEEKVDVVGVEKEFISRESEGELSFDDSRHTTSFDVQNDFNEDVSGEDEDGIRSKATYTAAIATRRIANRRARRGKFVCDKCSKYFQKEINFIAHIQRHEGLKPYHCMYEGCDKTYAWPKLLKDHESLHTTLNSEHGLKRYRCTHEGCNKSFSWPATLQRHQRKHKNLNIDLGRKIYHCMYEGCNKSFSWPATLKRHQKRHAKIFEDSLQNPETQFNKEPIETEGTNDLLHSSEAVFKEEYELNDQNFVSNRETAPIVKPIGVNDPAEVFEESIENDYSEINSVQKLTQKEIKFEQDINAESEDIFMYTLNTTFSNENSDSKHRSQSAKGKVAQMAVDDLKAVMSVRNEPIPNESEGLMSCDNSRHTTSSLNVHNDFHEDASGKDEHGITSKTTDTASKTTRKPATGRAKKRYHCNKCQKGFNKEKNYIIHIRKHEGLKPYHCTHEGCYKSYEWLEHLEKHQSTHNELNSEHTVKPYPCTHEGCNKSFSYPSQLKRHEQRHEHPNIEHLKIYHCMHEGCNKSYEYQGTLEAHQRQHENPKSYYCMHEGCNKSYSWPSDLKLHERRHTHPRMYRCKNKGCDKSYLWANALRRHLKLGCQPE